MYLVILMVFAVGARPKRFWRAGSPSGQALIDSGAVSVKPLVEQKRHFVSVRDALEIGGIRNGVWIGRPRDQSPRLKERTYLLGTARVFLAHQFLDTSRLRWQ
jgi:hypothetical protein